MESDNRNSKQIDFLQELIKIQTESSKILNTAMSALSSARLSSESDKRSFLRTYQSRLTDYDFGSLERAADSELERHLYEKSKYGKK